MTLPLLERLLSAVQRAVVHAPLVFHLFPGTVAVELIQETIEQDTFICTLSAAAMPRK